MITSWLLCVVIAGRELCDLGAYSRQADCNREAEKRRGAYCVPRRL